MPVALRYRNIFFTFGFWVGLPQNLDFDFSVRSPNFRGSDQNALSRSNSNHAALVILTLNHTCKFIHIFFLFCNVEGYFGQECWRSAHGYATLSKNSGFPGRQAEQTRLAAGSVTCFRGGPQPPSPSPSEAAPSLLSN